MSELWLWVVLKLFFVGVSLAGRGGEGRGLLEELVERFESPGVVAVPEAVAVLWSFCLLVASLRRRGWLRPRRATWESCFFAGGAALDLPLSRRQAGE